MKLGNQPVSNADFRGIGKASPGVSELKGQVESSTALPSKAGVDPNFTFRDFLKKGETEAPSEGATKSDTVPGVPQAGQLSPEQVSAAALNMSVPPQAKNESPKASLAANGALPVVEFQSGPIKNNPNGTSPAVLQPLPGIVSHTPGAPQVQSGPATVATGAPQIVPGNAQKISDPGLTGTGKPSVGQSGTGPVSAPQKNNISLESEQQTPAFVRPAAQNSQETSAKPLAQNSPQNLAPFQSATPKPAQSAVTAESLGVLNSQINPHPIQGGAQIVAKKSETIKKPLVLQSALVLNPQQVQGAPLAAAQATLNQQANGMPVAPRKLSQDQSPKELYVNSALLGGSAAAVASGGGESSPVMEQFLKDLGVESIETVPGKSQPTVIGQNPGEAAPTLPDLDKPKALQFNKMGGQDFLSMREFSPNGVKSGEKLQRELPRMGEKSLENGSEKAMALDAMLPLSGHAASNNASSKPVEVQGQVTLGAMSQHRLSSTSVSDVSAQIAGFSNGGMGGGTGHVVIKLNPKGLGELKVQVHSQGGGQVTLQVQASSEDSKRILEQSIGSLKDNLSAQNLTLSKVEITSAPAMSADSSGSNQMPFGQNSFGGNERNQGLAFGQNEFGANGGQERSGESSDENGFGRPSLATGKGSSFSGKQAYDQGRVNILA